MQNEVVIDTTDPQPLSSHPWAWLSPDGKFYPVRECGHRAFAQQIAPKLGYNPETCYPDDKMEDAGWIHISYNIINTKHPTQRQIDTMFDWMMHFKEGSNYYLKFKYWLENVGAV